MTPVRFPSPMLGTKKCQFCERRMLRADLQEVDGLLICISDDDCMAANAVLVMRPKRQRARRTLTPEHRAAIAAGHARR